MKNKWTRRLLSAFVAVLTLVGLLLVACFPPHLEPNLPVYRGTNLYEWAAELQQVQLGARDPNRAQKVEAATRAIRMMGAKALPFVMDDIMAHPTPKDRVMSWLAKWAPFRKFQPAKIEARWYRGITALQVLGPLGKGYLPQLVALTSNTNFYYSAAALLAIGPDALPAFTNLLANSKFPETLFLIPELNRSVYAGRIKPTQAAVALPYLVRLFNDTNCFNRALAAMAFGVIHQHAKLCVPLLIGGLADSYRGVRGYCAESLGYFGAAVVPYVSNLASAFDSADLETRRTICNGLINFHSVPDVADPILVRALGDKDVSLRISAAEGLGEIGNSPDQVAPALAKAAVDGSALVRKAAIQSLSQLRPPSSNALSIIRRARFDLDPDVGNAATNALMRLTENSP